ncbi:hypothetical protein SEA_REFUGE_75 [Mycobacterium phage Refuge]|uniref:Uncharacterized protein n=1 Tax=Mycobacterium phage Refuge TaxID=2517967 RepID=A0A482JBW4_9CAUD|nr:hypothetical protein KIV61_gp28 [Mycobacterium phage Refuge]QBP31093.1 hypothetical protein SEA_REFUGE_75 [Mycobacterium phage Refuge]
MKVFIATVDTYYQTMAVAETAEEATRLAVVRAQAFLAEREHIMGTATQEEFVEYYGVNLTEIEVGTAILVT